jgi:thiosulfate reductase cytochrome b subunit
MLVPLIFSLHAVFTFLLVRFGLSFQEFFNLVLHIYSIFFNISPYSEHNKKMAQQAVPKSTTHQQEKVLKTARIIFLQIIFYLAVHASKKNFH